MRGDGFVLPVAAHSAPPTSIRHVFLVFIAVPDGWGTNGQTVHTEADPPC